MATTTDGGPAFPCDYEIGREVEYNERRETNESRQLLEARPGMSLRDWLAGQALAGLLAAHSGDGVPLPKPERAAEQVFEYADAVLKARDL